MAGQDDENEGTRARRRSVRAREAILRATIELAGERDQAELSIEGIASRAGVGKATIYRWWPNKTAVLLDAVLATLGGHRPQPDSGCARDDLLVQMLAAASLLDGEQFSNALTMLLAASQRDPQVAAALRLRFISDRRADGREVLRRGIDRGELRADTEPDLLLDMLYGALYYRLLVSGQNPDAAYVRALLDQVWPLWQSARPAGGAGAGEPDPAAEVAAAPASRPGRST